MESVLLVGAGDFAKEIAQWVDQSGVYKVKGFLCDNPLEVTDSPYDVFSIDDYSYGDEKLVLAIASTNDKQDVVSRIEKLGGVFTSFIHPLALIANTAVVGKGAVLLPNVVVSNNAKIGDFVSINLASTIGHDVIIDDFVTISSQNDLCGHVVIGKGALLGSKVSILPKKKVGMNATVGAGSLVLRNVAADSTVFGNPAKKL